MRHFIGKPVVQLIESTEKLPFDLLDVNTIRVDHTDLESVDEAKRRLRDFITASTTAEGRITNPISSVLDALNIQVKGGRDRKTLAEAFESFAAQITQELRDSSAELEDLSGIWRSNVGAVQLVQEGMKLTGKYEYSSR